MLLNGGKSSRMGTAKGALKIGELTLVQYMTQQLAAAGVSDIVISGDEVPDQFADQGPLGGIEAVLTAHPGARWLVVPIDMPQLDVATLRQLIDQGEMAHTCVHFAASVLPLYIASGDDCLASVRACLRSDNHKHWSIRNWLASQQCCRVAAPNESVLDNINTPQQWHSFLANNNL
nr:molybdenum cofactor guanylyltransferase [Neiella litorisoli]